MPNELTVEQVDREAAWDLLRSRNVELAEQIKAGKNDSHFYVRRFARHRLDAEQRVREQWQAGSGAAITALVETVHPPMPVANVPEESQATLEAIATAVEEAVAGGMSWISHSEAYDFARRIRNVAGRLVASNVPREPTAEMVRAGGLAVNPDDDVLVVTGEGLVERALAVCDDVIEEYEAHPGAAIEAALSRVRERIAALSTHSAPAMGEDGLRALRLAEEILAVKLGTGRSSEQERVALHAVREVLSPSPDPKP